MMHLNVILHLRVRYTVVGCWALTSFDLLVDTAR